MKTFIVILLSMVFTFYGLGLIDKKRLANGDEPYFDVYHSLTRDGGSYESWVSPIYVAEHKFYVDSTTMNRSLIKKDWKWRHFALFCLLLAVIILKLSLSKHQKKNVVEQVAAPDA